MQTCVENDGSKENDWPLYHPLWFFSLKVYQSPRVARQCLMWQNQYKLDVNLLLGCVWLFRYQVPLNQWEFGELAALATSWQREKVVPIREYRQRLTHKINNSWVSWQPALHQERRRQLRLELQQEQKEQAMIWQWVSDRHLLARLPQASHQNHLSSFNVIYHLAHFYGIAYEKLRDTILQWPY